MKKILLFACIFASLVLKAQLAPNVTHYIGNPVKCGDTLQILTGAHAGYIAVCLDDSGTLGWRAGAANDSIWTQVADSIYLTSQTGMVGIGITSPQATLHVVGTRLMVGNDSSVTNANNQRIIVTHTFPYDPHDPFAYSTVFFPDTTDHHSYTSVKLSSDTVNYSDSCTYEQECRWRGGSVVNTYLGQTLQAIRTITTPSGNQTVIYNDSSRIRLGTGLSGDIYNPNSANNNTIDILQPNDGIQNGEILISANDSVRDYGSLIRVGGQSGEIKLSTFDFSGTLFNSVSAFKDSLTIFYPTGGITPLMVSKTLSRFLVPIQIVDGTQGAGKVLTSDADGNATWHPNFILTNSGFQIAYSTGDNFALFDTTGREVQFGDNAHIYNGSFFDLNDITKTISAIADSGVGIGGTNNQINFFSHNLTGSHRRELANVDGNETVITNGATGSEPTPTYLGQLYFDTTLVKMKFWNGSVWAVLTSTP